MMEQKHSFLLNLAGLQKLTAAANVTTIQLRERERERERVRKGEEKDDGVEESKEAKENRNE